MLAQPAQAPFDDEEPPSMDAPALTIELEHSGSAGADDADDGEDMQAEEEERGDSFDADEAYEKFALACLSAVQLLARLYLQSAFFAIPRLWYRRGASKVCFPGRNGASCERSPHAANTEPAGTAIAILHNPIQL